MNQTLSLYRLQQIDLQIDRLQARLHTIQAILDDDAEMRQLNEQTRTIEALYQAAEEALKQAEADVQSQHIKIEQTQSSLYGAKSHSPKELLDLQNDLASLKRHLVVLEDRQIEAMMASETAEADLQSAQQARTSRLKKIRVCTWNMRHLRMISIGFSSSAMPLQEPSRQPIWLFTINYASSAVVLPWQ
jgi:predicted  nucleic acid-binding Zn-ribbon protein